MDAALDSKENGHIAMRMLYKEYRIVHVKIKASCIMACFVLVGKTGEYHLEQSSPFFVLQAPCLVPFNCLQGIKKPYQLVSAESSRSKEVTLKVEGHT